MKPVTRTRVFAAVLAIALCACGSDRGDPLIAGNEELEFGGTLFSGGNLANTAVSEQSKYDFCNQLFAPVWRAYTAALQAAGTAPDTNGVRIVGARTGYAIVDSRSLRTILEGYSFVQFDAEVTFNDFSDDGILFMGGEVIFDGLWRDLAGNRLPYDINMHGGVEFAGGYRGSAAFLGITGFKLLTDTLGTLIPAGEMAVGYETDGFLRIKSGQDELKVYPYPTP